MDGFLRYQLEEVHEIRKYDSQIRGGDSGHEREVLESFHRSWYESDGWVGNHFFLPRSEMHSYFCGTDEEIRSDLMLLARRYTITDDDVVIGVISDAVLTEEGILITISKELTSFLLEHGYQKHEGYRDAFIVRECEECFDFVTGKTGWVTLVHTPLHIHEPQEDVRSKIREYIESYTEDDYRFELVMELDEKVWEFRVFTGELVEFGMEKG